MFFSPSAIVLFLSLQGASSFPVKWCLEYLPIGHVRTDPIINPSCLSDHVHTFYGPGKLRPETTTLDLVNTPVSETSGEVVENKSLYWHPSIYRVETNPSSGTKTYIRSQIQQTTIYYRFDDTRREEMIPFPEGLVMIGGRGLDSTTNSECCNGDDEACIFGSDTGKMFPSRACEAFAIWMEFPICWNGELDSEDHSSHVAYTVDGTLDGDCPPTHQAGRFPEIQVFVHLGPYPGGEHTLSDGSSILHADFMNAWNETALQSILDNCEPDDLANADACGCQDFLTLKTVPDDSEVSDTTLAVVSRQGEDGEEEDEEGDCEEEDCDPDDEEEEVDEHEEDDDDGGEEDGDDDEDDDEEDEEEEDDEHEEDDDDGGDEDGDDDEEGGEDEEEDDDEEEEVDGEESLLEQVQPPPLDTKAIAAEEVDVVVGSLPRGACIGDVVPIDG